MNALERVQQIEIGERWGKYLAAVGYDSAKLNPWQLYNLGGMVMKHVAVQEAAMSKARASKNVIIDSLSAAASLPKETKAAIRVQLDTAKAALPACHL
jgi:hypothetical protein